MDYERISEDRNEIVIKDLVKNFGDVTAVNGLTLDVKKGEMFGFLGPNGAGKTTTISMLCGLLEPTAGSAQIGGFDVGKQPQSLKGRYIGEGNRSVSPMSRVHLQLWSFTDLGCGIALGSLVHNASLALASPEQGRSWRVQ